MPGEALVELRDARRGCRRARRARSPRRGRASRRSSSGLPVTTPSTEWPLFIEYVSKIQAIVEPSVPTSGAGMSFSGPISLMISLVKRRVIRSSSRARHLLRVADDAALRAAERDAHQRALPRHPHRERLDLVDGDVGVVADAALRRAARDVVGDAVALEDLRRAVVHADGDRDLDRLLALAEHGDEVRVDLEGRADARGAARAPARTGSRAGGTSLRLPRSTPFVAANGAENRTPRRA